MAFAVSLLLDAKVADAVGKYWRTLADYNVSRSMLDLNYPPHITLAVYDVLNVDDAVVTLNDVFANFGALNVAFNSIKTFEAGSGVLYAALESSGDLMNLHTTVVAAIGEACRPHYQIGKWTPHCTLATGVSDDELDRAQKILGSIWRPLSGSFKVASLVEFLPVLSIKNWALGERPAPTRTL